MYLCVYIHDTPLKGINAPSFISPYIYARQLSDTVRKGPDHKSHSYISYSNAWQFRLFSST